MADKFSFVICVKDKASFVPSPCRPDMMYRTDADYSKGKNLLSGSTCTVSPEVTSLHVTRWPCHAQDPRLDTSLSLSTSVSCFCCRLPFPPKHLFWSQARCTSLKKQKKKSFNCPLVCLKFHSAALRGLCLLPTVVAGSLCES